MAGKNKHHAVVSTDAGKTLGKIPLPLRMESHKTVGVERTPLVVKRLRTASPQLASHSREKLKAFPPRSGTRQGGLLSPLSFTWCRSLTPQPSDKKKKGKARNQKERFQTVPVCKRRDIRAEKPSDCPQKPLELINEIRKLRI